LPGQLREKLDIPLLSPVIAKMKIKLKPANDLLAITSLIKLFHSVTKRIFCNVEPNTFFVTLIDDDLLNWILI